MRIFSYLLLLGFCSSHQGFAEMMPDPETGYSYLVNGDYIGCGVPVTVMKRAIASKNLIPKQIMSSFFPMAADEIFNAEPLLGRNSDNASVVPSFNVFETNRGIKAMNFSCLSCHGESINGKFVVGLGNRSRDFTQDLRRFSQFLPLFAWTPAEREEVGLFNRAMNAIGPYVQTKTVGVNPAINLTYALFSNRNSDDFSWSEKHTLAPPPTEFAPVDVPPWWRMGLKHSMFYNSEFSRNHHRIMTLASALCINGRDELLALEKPFINVEAFIKKLKAPVYPGVIDKQLAEKGEAIFNDKCSRCHGTYGENGHYEEKNIPIEVVGTDPGLMEQQTGPEYQRFRDWGETTFMNLTGEEFGARGKRGYLAPPLNGIWATAPFFHNGSVPHLEGVLNSSLRPSYWRRINVSRKDDYDVEHIALRFESLDYGQASALPFLKRYIYDTTLAGYSNQGHTFGDRLTNEERAAVIEYLKGL